MKGLRPIGLIFLAAWPGIVLPVEARTTIYAIRYGVHTDFDRVVFELSAPLDCRIESVDSEHLRIHLGHVEVSPTFRAASLPEKTVSLLSARASGGGKKPFVVDLRVRAAAKASILKLKGSPSRIAVDITPTQAARPTKEKPDYVPGDRPFPTKFAERIAPPVGIDEAKVHAILAYYFAAIGDSVKALHEASAYESATGKTLDVVPEPIPTKPPVSAPGLPSVLFEWLRVDYLIAFLAGMLGYTFAALLSLLVGAWKRRHTRDQAADLVARAHRIRKVYDRAAVQEAQSEAGTVASAEHPEPSSQEETEQETALSEPTELQRTKESATEQRVQRVMELATGGKTVADIAQELEMSQDEVKLILDLKR